MKSVALVLAFGVVVSMNASAASPKPLSTDMSSDFLMDAGSAAQIWKDNTPASVRKLYPASRFRFVSEVSGGFNEARVCVVTARAMLLPVVRLPVQGAKPVYSPIKSATAFDAVGDLSVEKCQALARVKLTEAVRSVSAALAAT